MTKKIMTGCFLILLLTPQFGQATGRQKIALIIGNSAYNTRPLSNPVNDADDMAAALDRLNFKTIKIKNADRRKMVEAIHSFGSRLRNQGMVGLFYYAGHAVQVAGRNYLLPVGFDVHSASDIEFEAVDMSRVLGKMVDAGTDVNILILDSCRDNPFSASFRSISGGLARVSAPKGTFIAFATAPGMTAADGNGRNGIFTHALLKHIATPGLTIEQIMNRARVDTVLATRDKQIPWHSSSMMGDFFFLPGANPADTITPTLKLMTIKHIESKVNTEKRKIDGWKRRPDKIIDRKGLYIKYSNGIILDTGMGLAWMQKPIGIMSWLKAQKQVRQINRQGLMGYNDWRLPNKGELLHVARFARKHRGFFSGDDMWHWSATQTGPLTAWLINFGHADIPRDELDATSMKMDFETPYTIRLVRSVLSKIE